MAEALKTHAAGALRLAQAGQAVTLAGWVGRRRDHGGVVFLDLRDGSGIVQVVADPAQIPDVRSEYCIRVTGEVRPRPPGTENPDLATGSIEVAAGSVEVLSPSETLPFVLDDRAEVEERTRLQYRYLDLRRPRMAANLRARSAAIQAMRRTLDDRGFLEVETPTLVVSTPEGARDLLVPSRLRPGTFYALPQSPQLFKQLLMVAGVERYYQVARCYRDEDFRADRQIEFTQLDLEGSFWGREEVLSTLEEVVAAAITAVRDVEVSRPFPRLTYAEAMLRYGTDKPDIRFSMEITDLSSAFLHTEFQGFAFVLEGGGVVRGINAGRIDASRSRLDSLSAVAQELGAKGLVWMVIEDGARVRSPVAKFLAQKEVKAVIDALSGRPGEVLLLVGDRARVAAEALGRLRLELGRPTGHAELRPLFVVDFPVFEVDDAGNLTPAHHPFTSPVDVEEMGRRPESALARAYDLVLNGSELGSGSVRIHDPAVQRKVFEILGIGEEAARQRFGWFLEALRYGTPPHAGFAIGIDRFVSILQDEPNIREVIPFPKTQTGADPLTGSPSPVEEFQLEELGIKLTGNN